MQRLKEEAIRWAVTCGLIATLSVPVAVQLMPASAQQPPVAAAAPKPATPSSQESIIGNAPSMTTATYGDWVVRCSQRAEKRVCEVEQTLYVQGQLKPVALIAIGREKPTEPIRLVVQLPVNVTISGHLKITLKEGLPAFDLNIEHCVPTGCFVVLQPADEFLRQLRAQADPARISYKDAAQHDVARPFSLRGLSQALDALPKG